MMNLSRGHPEQHFGSTTYSQHGDDLMILNLFSLMGIQKPSYLDLGAHHPVNISNTALLYARGSRGINVEANPNLIDTFRLMRPSDINVNVGVGPREGNFKFYKYSQTSGRNTFSLQEVKSLAGTLTVKEEILLPVKTLPQIIDQYCNGSYPDLLSCDIEGLDYEVLDQLPEDWEWDTPNGTPKLICVETRKHETLPMKEMIERKGYRLYCQMGENLFFVRNDFVEKIY